MQLPTPHDRARAKRVFLAEDDDDLRDALEGLLGRRGFDVVAVASGHEMLRAMSAVARGERAEPDAILLDIRMGSGSGLDVLLALRLADWTQPVVMMTGYADPRTHERAAEYGAAVILDKPFDGEDLVRILQIVIATHPRGLDDDDDDEPPTLRSPGRDPWPAARLG